MFINVLLSQNAIQWHRLTLQRVYLRDHAQISPSLSLNPHCCYHVILPQLIADIPTCFLRLRGLTTDGQRVLVFLQSA